MALHARFPLKYDFSIGIKMSLKSKIKQSLIVSEATVFVRADFVKLGGYDQIGRALRELITEQLIVNVGYGVYVKARLSSISGNPIPIVTMTEVGLQLMKKLNIEADVGKFARDYREGKSPQIPMREVIAVRDSNINRRISWAGKVLI